MAAGAWGGADVLHYKVIDIDNLLDDCTDEAYGWFYAKLYGEMCFTIDAYFRCGYDNSTGVSSFADFDEWFPNEEIDKLIDECPFLNAETREALHGQIEKEAEDENGYEPYEID